MDISSVDCFTWNAQWGQHQAMLENTDLTAEERAARITEAINRVVPSRMTKAALAEACGVTAQAVTGWQDSGRISRPSMRRLALVTSRPLEFFMVRDWDRLDEWDNVLGYAQAAGLGNGPEAQEYAETHKLKFRADSLARKRLRADKLAVMYGTGDSMLPRIHTGDAILFDISDTRPVDGALYVIQVHGVAGREYQVKRAMLIDDVVYFVADNPAGDHSWKKPKRMDAKRGQIEIIGRVRWIGSWEG